MIATPCPEPQPKTKSGKEQRAQDGHGIKARNEGKVDVIAAIEDDEEANQERQRRNATGIVAQRETPSQKTHGDDDQGANDSHGNGCRQSRTRDELIGHVEQDGWHDAKEAVVIPPRRRHDPRRWGRIRCRWRHAHYNRMGCPNRQALGKRAGQEWSGHAVGHQPDARIDHFRSNG